MINQPPRDKQSREVGQLQSRRLRYKYPKLGYVLSRWPAGLYLLPKQTDPQIEQVPLDAIASYAGLSKLTSLKHRTGFSKQAFRHLTKPLQQRLSLNAYHSLSHIKQVIVASGLLAKASDLPQRDTDRLMMAALIHDYRHLGRRRPNISGWQEAASLRQALPIFQKYGLSGQNYQLLHRLIMATNPKARSDHASCQITSLLLDADLFGSLFLPKIAVDTMTKSLRFEEGLCLDHKALLENFLAHCAMKGFASPVTAKLHAALPAHITYFDRATYYDLAHNQTAANGQKAGR